MKNRLLKLVKMNVFELKDKDICDDTKLISTGYLESFDVINLISVFDNEFGIDINLEEIDLSYFETINSMEELVRKYVKE